MYLETCVVLLFLLLGISLGDNTLRVYNAEELIKLSKNVTAGTNYSGTTVYLDSDIDFNGKSIDPIGKYAKPFLGTFDGKGHTVSNLNVTSSSERVGLFGFSNGMTIRNIVIEDSCSVTSIYSSSSGNGYLGGVIAYCESEQNSCIIENIVSMASVIFNGGNNPSLNIGGVVGELSSNSFYDSFVKNCVSYATVSHSTVEGSLIIGGIVGQAFGSSKKVFIQNCLNYGVATETSNIFIGIIIGSSEYIVIEICVSAGNATFMTELNTTTMSKLNEYASENSWNRWLLNMGNNSISFKIKNYKGFALSSQIILLPDFADNDIHPFSGWYSDENMTTPFESSEVEADIALYGMFCEQGITVTLDVNGGTELAEESIIILCNETYEGLPVPGRTGYTFDGWFTEADGGGKVEPTSKVTNLNNHTLYAHWTINQYTVIFIFDNGTEPEVRTLYFNASVVYPKDVQREGYTFNGWDKAIEFMPAENITITAQWTINQYTITFIFDNGTEPLVRTLDFNASFEYPKDIQREGYTFNGWDKTAEFMPAENITITAQWNINQYVVTFILGDGTEPLVRTLDFNASIVYPKDVQREGYTFNGWDKIVTEIPASNLTITAQWREKPIEFVEIVFGKKDMKEEEAEEVIKKYAKEGEFKIEKFEVNEKTGEARVIIKFIDTEKSEEFIRDINENIKSEDDFIISANGVEYLVSFSYITTPLLDLALLLI